MIATMLENRTARFEGKRKVNGIAIASALSINVEIIGD